MKDTEKRKTAKNIAPVLLLLHLLLGHVMIIFLIILIVIQWQENSFSFHLVLHHTYLIGFSLLDSRRMKTVFILALSFLKQHSSSCTTRMTAGSRMARGPPSIFIYQLLKITSRIPLFPYLLLARNCNILFYCLELLLIRRECLLNIILPAIHLFV